METNGERNRTLYILKSRGMAHSNQVREFVMTDQGVELVDVYLGPSGVVTGTARYVQEARERAEAQNRRQEMEARQRDLERQRDTVQRQIASLQADFEAREEELQRLITQEQRWEQLRGADRAALARLRFEEAPNGDSVASGTGGQH
jgi:circadian clock protein KaiC